MKVVTGKDGQAVTPVAIATQLPPNVSAAFSTQQQFQVIKTYLFNFKVSFMIYYFINFKCIIPKPCDHCFQGVVAISSSGDMDNFKRQQAMVQAGRARVANSCVSYVALFPPRLLCFLFLFFFPSNCFCF